MDRKQAYEIIKAQNLQKYISEKFGKPYSSVSTDDLVSFINETINTNISKATKPEKKSKTKKVLGKKEPKMCGLLNIDYHSIVIRKQITESCVKGLEKEIEDLNTKIKVNGLLGGDNKIFNEDIVSFNESISIVKKQIEDCNSKLSEYEVKKFHILDYAGNNFPNELKYIKHDITDKLFTKLIRYIFENFPTRRTSYGNDNDTIDINFAEYGVTVYLGDVIVDTLHVYFGDESENSKWCQITLSGKNVDALLKKKEYYDLISPEYIYREKQSIHSANCINYNHFGNMAVIRDPETDYELSSFHVVSSEICVDGKNLECCPDIKYYYWLLKLLNITL